MWLGRLRRGRLRRPSFFSEIVYYVIPGASPHCKGNHVFTNVGYLRMEEYYMEGIGGTFCVQLLQSGDNTF